MGAVQDVLGEVFGFFHIRSPPLGSAYFLTGNLGIGIQVEEGPGCIVARIFLQFGKSCIGCREGVVEVGIVIPVVGSRHGQIAGRLVLVASSILLVTSQHSYFTRHVQEQVVLERCAAGNNLKTKETHVIGIL